MEKGKKNLKYTSSKLNTYFGVHDSNFVLRNICVSNIECDSQKLKFYFFFILFLSMFHLRLKKY